MPTARYNSNRGHVSREAIDLRALRSKDAQPRNLPPIRGTRYEPSRRRPLQTPRRLDADTRRERDRA